MTRLPAVGASVLIHARMIRVDSDTGERVWMSDPVDWRGIVTGYSHRCDGQYMPASGGGVSMFGEDPSDYEPAYLSVTRKHLVLLVRTSAWGAEFPVFPADTSPAPVDAWQLPSRRGLASWTDDTRRNMRAEMSTWPRDARGRWIKP